MTAATNLEVPKPQTWERGATMAGEERALPADIVHFLHR
jgi:hypothetical protein